MKKFLVGFGIVAMVIGAIGVGASIWMFSSYGCVTESFVYMAMGLGVMCGYGFMIYKTVQEMPLTRKFDYATSTIEEVEEFVEGVDVIDIRFSTNALYVKYEGL